jgi:hypothetical protein
LLSKAAAAVVMVFETKNEDEEEEGGSVRSGEEGEAAGFSDPPTSAG